MSDVTTPPAITPNASAADRWPAFFGPLAFVVGFAAAAVAGVFILLAAGLFGADTANAPGGIVLAQTLAQDLLLLATAIFLASRAGRVRASDLGLRGAPVARAILTVVLALVLFYAVVAAWSALIADQGRQDILDTLGARDSGAAMVATGVLVIGVAPLCEELFFRGFIYRALRNRFSAAGSVSVVAVVFGAIHYTDTDTLPLLPLLALLGAIFCIVYEMTGSLWPAIAIHVVNNALAFAGGVGTLSAGVIAAVAAVGMLAICTVGLRRRDAPPIISVPPVALADTA